MSYYNTFFNFTLKNKVQVSQSIGCFSRKQHSSNDIHLVFSLDFLHYASISWTFLELRILTLHSFLVAYICYCSYLYFVNHVVRHNISCFDASYLLILELAISDLIFYLEWCFTCLINIY